MADEFGMVHLPVVVFVLVKAKANVDEHLLSLDELVCV
jgi:hypothetical protein